MRGAKIPREVEAYRAKTMRSFIGRHEKVSGGNQIHKTGRLQTQNNYYYNG